MFSSLKAALRPPASNKTACHRLRCAICRSEFWSFSGGASFWCISAFPSARSPPTCLRIESEGANLELDAAYSDDLRVSSAISVDDGLSLVSPTDARRYLSN